MTLESIWLQNDEKVVSKESAMIPRAAKLHNVSEHRSHCRLQGVVVHVYRILHRQSTVALGKNVLNPGPTFWD